MAERSAIRFLTDNNVPDAIGAWLVARGHDVVRLRDVLAENTPDPLVANAAMSDARVLLTWDKGFDSQSFRTPPFRPLWKVIFECDYMHAETRLNTLIGRIEDEHARATVDAPLGLKIGRDRLVIYC